MRTILAAVLMLVGGVAFGQVGGTVAGADGARGHMLYSRQATVNLGMVIAPNYRSDAVNGGGHPVLISAGDGHYTSGTTAETAADGLRSQADAAYAAGNYGVAANLYGRAMGKYRNASTFFTGSKECWRLSLRPSYGR